MPHRLAATLALLSFVVCLAVGQVSAGNPFVTTVGRAVAAMAATYGVGLVVGLMGRRAIDDSMPPADPPVAVPVPPGLAPAVKPPAAGGR